MIDYEDILLVLLGREIRVVRNCWLYNLTDWLLDMLLVLFGGGKSHKCLNVQISRDTNSFHELSAHLKDFFVTVPASLEGVIGDLEIEINEGEKNLEFDKDGVMHKEITTRNETYLYFNSSTSQNG